MTLTDAGPLVALIDADEPDHQRCVDTLDDLSLPLLTTWLAFTEAMYLLGDAGGNLAQQALWHLVKSERLLLADLSPESTDRCATLMAKYADRPMDLADATLVALAEARRIRQIFSLDGDFRIYRLHGRRHFDVVPN